MRWREIMWSKRERCTFSLIKSWYRFGQNTRRTLLFKDGVWSLHCNTCWSHWICMIFMSSMSHAVRYVWMHVAKVQPHSSIRLDESHDNHFLSLSFSGLKHVWLMTLKKRNHSSLWKKKKRVSNSYLISFVYTNDRIKKERVECNQMKWVDYRI